MFNGPSTPNDFISITASFGLLICLTDTVIGRMGGMHILSSCYSDGYAIPNVQILSNEQVTSEIIPIVRN